MSAPQVVVGVGGGIAAYKSAELIRRISALGAQVTVCATEAALRFVGVATFEALSGRPVLTDVFTDVPSVAHVRTGQQADLVVVAPATADLLAKAANGFADDMLTSTLLVTRAPVLFAPAMHTEMWLHPATVANVATLRARGNVVLDPAVGRLTGPDSGPGRLPEPDQLAQVAELLLRRPDALPRDLEGTRVVISAGGTREALDPVRFLTNRSSGRQGFALALVAGARGALVTLVAANVTLPAPPGVELVDVSDARELHTIMLDRSRDADVVVMSAAVADFRPEIHSEAKIKKTGAEPEPLRLIKNPDILVDLVKHRGSSQTVVGFAAETGDAEAGYLEHGRRKLARKGCDLLVVNQVGTNQGFESEHNEVVVLSRAGSDGPTRIAHSNAGTEPAVAETHVRNGPKTVIAAAIWDVIAATRAP